MDHTRDSFLACFHLFLFVCFFFFGVVGLMLCSKAAVRESPTVDLNKHPGEKEVNQKTMKKKRSVRRQGIEP